MRTTDLKIRYGIMIVTALLFLLAVKSSFGQNSNASFDRSEKAEGQPKVQSELQVDPLSPAINFNDNSGKSTTENGIVQLDGRNVSVDSQGVQSLSVPVQVKSKPEKNKTISTNID